MDFKLPSSIEAVLKELKDGGVFSLRDYFTAKPEKREHDTPSYVEIDSKTRFFYIFPADERMFSFLFHHFKSFKNRSFTYGNTPPSDPSSLIYEMVENNSVILHDDTEAKGVFIKDDDGEKNLMWVALLAPKDKPTFHTPESSLFLGRPRYCFDIERDDILHFILQEAISLKNDHFSKCGICSVKIPKHRAYCDECKDKPKTKSGGMGDFPDADRSYQSKKGREDARRILTCSVECLLAELGDLE